jgi:hypothetical protein
MMSIIRKNGVLVCLELPTTFEASGDKTQMYWLCLMDHICVIR